MEAEHAGHHGEEVLGGAGSECLHVGRLPGFATSRRTTRSTCGEPDRGLRLCAITGPMAVGSRSMRAEASVLHIDLDAFFAAVEQRDKPSLRGRPVIIGGVGGRGVVATASYEDRAVGVRSAMSTREARSRSHHAAFMHGRFNPSCTARPQLM